MKYESTYWPKCKEHLYKVVILSSEKTVYISCSPDVTCFPCGLPSPTASPVAAMGREAASPTISQGGENMTLLLSPQHLASS